MIEMFGVPHTEVDLILVNGVSVDFTYLVRDGDRVRETNTRRQLVEVLRRFDLFGSTAPFQRCLRCNGNLQPVSIDLVSAKLRPRTLELYHEFRICADCGRIYWKGSHYERMQRFIQEVVRH